MKGVLMDIAGVLWQGEEALSGAVEAMAALRESGMPVRFLTNTTRTPKARLCERLRRLGFAAEPDEVFTPAGAAVDWLAAEGRTPHLLIHPDLAVDFDGCRSEGPVAVVVGDAGRFFSYEAMNVAFRKIAGGAPLLALAMNRVFRDADGELSLDAGAFVRALEFAGDTQAIVLGKPAAGFFEAAAAGMGLAPKDVAMIGDDAESDVAGALRAGAGAAILVRTGKYRDGDEDRFEPRPTRVAADVAAAVAGLTG